VHLVGFIIRIYHDAWSPERQIPSLCLSVHPFACNNLAHNLICDYVSQFKFH